MNELSLQGFNSITSCSSAIGHGAMTRVELASSDVVVGGVAEKRQRHHIEASTRSNNGSKNTRNRSYKNKNSSVHDNKNVVITQRRRFSRQKLTTCNDGETARIDPQQLRWKANDSEVMELSAGSGVYIKLPDLLNVCYRTKSAISAARRLLVCVFNDQTLMERSVKGSPDRPALCPVTHKVILGCVKSIGRCKPATWAADEAAINRSLIVRLCELRSKRTSTIYTTSRPDPALSRARQLSDYLSVCGGDDGGADGGADCC